MAPSTAQLQRLAFALAGLCFLVAAVLMISTSWRAGPALAALGAAALTVALWASARSISRSVAAQRRATARVTDLLGVGPSPTSSAEVLLAVQQVSASLRDLPVVAQQSIVVGETVHGLDVAVNTLAEKMQRIENATPASSS